jgi:redox-sensitive bicupin YhaK (pirin superfamily)
MLIEPRRRRIGDDEVDRLLPFRSRRMVGPFIYADLIGPSSLPPGVGVDVPVHPHIGLATVTYLFEGALVHRDSTGAVQRIEPGAVNWMTAGRAVSHSERSPDDERAGATTISGLQTWVALPEHAEEDRPSFVHVAASAVPEWVDGSVRVRLVAGELDGHRSPVPARSPICYLDLTFDGAGEWVAPATIGDRGVVVITGAVHVDGAPVPERHLLVVDDSSPGRIGSTGPARVVVLGGEPVGERIISWNFVASRRELIDRARDAWRDRDWPLVDGDGEIVPLPH